MIDLVIRSDRRGFGLEAALAIAGVPRRRADAPGNDQLAVIGTGAGPQPRAGAPALVVGSAPDGSSAVTTGALAMSLDDPIWPATVRATATRFGIGTLHVPRATIVCAEAPPAAAVLATARTGDGRSIPAVLAHEGRWWTPIDLGSALADLLDETYRPADVPPPVPAVLRPVLAAYYRAPEALRAPLQRRAYARLARGLDAHASTYPADATGWLLIELLCELVRRAAGVLVRIAPWPAPYAAAAALTHDVEPTAFSYGRGLDALLAGIAASGHPATLGLVAGPASRRLDAARRAAVAGHGVLCHGLEHRGETVAGSPAEVLAGVRRARSLLEGAIGRPVDGFRSPRLDRSPALLRALDEAGFRWDSSYPDVDRENVARFGGGVRLSVPFRPPIEEHGVVRPSRCLELPVSAPDCIQPLFAGEDVAALRRAVETKIDFVRRTGGLYTGIVHAGVFGPGDAARRGEHLAFVARQLRRPDVWLARAEDVVEWWSAREQLDVRVGRDRVEVTNRSARTLDGVRVSIDTGHGAVDRPLPSLAAGQGTSVDLGAAEAPASAVGGVS